MCTHYAPNPSLDETSPGYGALAIGYQASGIGHLLLKPINSSLQYASTIPLTKTNSLLAIILDTFIPVFRSRFRSITMVKDQFHPIRVREEACCPPSSCHRHQA